jgi:hypothetical protein
MKRSAGGGRPGPGRHHVTVPVISPASSRTDATVGAGSGVNWLPWKIPDRDFPAHASGPVTALPPALAQPR